MDGHQLDTGGWQRNKCSWCQRRRHPWGDIAGFRAGSSGTVGFFGLTAANIGALEVDGTGTWTVAGTGGVGNKINRLDVTAGATVTVNSQIAVKNVVVEATAGGGTPLIILNDGLPPGAMIGVLNQIVGDAISFDGTYSAIGLTVGGTALANVAVEGNVQLSGPPASDGNGGSLLTVTGTKPFVSKCCPYS
ncbi:MAG: hypothetical protein ACJ8AI_03205 [Rhodopila sp.]